MTELISIGLFLSELYIIKRIEGLTGLENDMSLSNLAIAVLPLFIQSY
jgi:hypothetical protein